MKIKLFKFMRQKLLFDMQTIHANFYALLHSSCCYISGSGFLSKPKKLSKSLFRWAWWFVFCLVPQSINLHSVLFLSFCEHTRIWLSESINVHLAIPIQFENILQSKSNDKIEYGPFKNKNSKVFRYNNRNEFMISKKNWKIWKMNMN